MDKVDFQAERPQVQHNFVVAMPNYNEYIDTVPSNYNFTYTLYLTCDTHVF